MGRSRDVCVVFSRVYQERKRWRDGRGEGGGGGGKRTNGEPFDDVGIGGAAGAAAVLFVAEGFDHDGVVEGT